MPAHVCENENLAAAAARSCVMRPLSGSAFVQRLTRWVALGHISVEEANGMT